MNPIDIGLIVILAFFVIKGLIRGIILEVLTLAGIVLGYLIALRQLGVAAEVLKKTIHLDGTTADVAGFLAVFLIVFVSCRIAAEIIRKLFSKTPVGLMDKGGGALFGALKGMLVCGLLAVLIHMIPVKPEGFEKTEKEAFLLDPCYHVAMGVFNAFHYLMPNTRDFTHELKEGLSGRAEEIKKQMMQEQIKSIEKQINDKIEEH